GPPGGGAGWPMGLRRGPRRASRGGGEPGQSGLRHLHVRLDRSAEGRDGGAPAVGALRARGHAAAGSAGGSELRVGVNLRGGSGPYDAVSGAVRRRGAARVERGAGGGPRTDGGGIAAVSGGLPEDRAVASGSAAGGSGAAGGAAAEVAGAGWGGVALGAGGPGGGGRCVPDRQPLRADGDDGGSGGGGGVGVGCAGGCDGAAGLAAAQ